jgi:isoleucyl-tRNA synthetase
MGLVKKLVSLGHSSRQSAKLKVRQPLAEAAFWVGSRAEVDLIARYADLISEDLNVKKVRSLDSVTEAIAYSLHPLPKQLGQKYGKLFPAIRQVLLALPPTVTSRALLAEETVTVQLETETFEILPEEVEVRLTAKEGFAVAEESGLVAALVTDLTPELVREGLAREVVRRLQELRKSRGFEISDRIHITCAASGKLAQAIDEQRTYIMGEALALSLTFEQKIEGDTLDVAGERLSLRLERVK